VEVLRSVVLLHTLVDGSTHYDWLLERAHAADGSEGALMAWRMTERPDSGIIEVGAMCRGERMADHRRLYLDYEGPISGGRGEVRRIACGEWVLEVEGAEVVEFRGRFEGWPTGKWMRWRAENSKRGFVWSLIGTAVLDL
jgi:hypothetical protein